LILGIKWSVNHDKNNPSVFWSSQNSAFKFVNRIIPTKPFSRLHYHWWKKVSCDAHTCQDLDRDSSVV
jgi:hypothetical protein